jgi:hypothetical protein
MAPLHPQVGVHALSLLNAPDASALHHPISLSAPQGIEMVGNEAAQTFWMNTARAIDWIREPTVAYGTVEGEKVSTISTAEGVGKGADDDSGSEQPGSLKLLSTYVTPTPRPPLET